MSTAAVIINQATDISKKIDESSNKKIEVTIYLEPPYDMPSESKPMTRSDLVNMVSSILHFMFCSNADAKLATLNDIPTPHKDTYYFQSKSVPSMTLFEYFNRIAKYLTPLSCESIIMSLVNIVQISQRHQTLPVNILTIHRLLLSSVVCTFKFHEDRELCMTTMAKVGGIDQKELDNLELTFLGLIDFDLFLPEHVYKTAYQFVVQVYKDGSISNDLCQTFKKNMSSIVFKRFN